MSGTPSIRIVAPRGVFRPRSDTWMLADFVGREVEAGFAVLDLCAGSGALGIAAARAGAGEVTAVDVSRRSTLAARLNAALNGVRIRTVRGDLFAPVGDRRFDLIVSNPPYLPSAQDRDEPPGREPPRAWEGGPDGRRFIDRIIAEAPEHLTPGGALLLIHSSVCDTGRTLERMEAAGLQSEVVERRTGAPGPLLAARMPELDEEELVVIRGSGG